MAVKGVKSASRVLATFEAVARHQPVGVGELARLMADDKSAVQRALVTLAGAGWIERVGDLPRWSVAARLLSLTAGRATLLERARPVLEALRDETGETALVGVAEATNVVVRDVCQSRRLIRAAPHAGQVVSPSTSSLGQSILAHLEPTEVAAFFDGAVDPELLVRLAEVRARGWAQKHHSRIPALNPDPDLHSVGAPILDADGRPIGAIVVTGPLDRMPKAVSVRFGRLVAAAARDLSAASVGPADRGPTGEGRMAVVRAVGGADG